MRKLIKRSLAMAIVLTLLLGLALITTAFADETDLANTIDLHMEVEQYKEELADSEIVLSFYRIGDMDDETLTAQKPADDFAALPIEGVESTKVNDELVEQAVTIAAGLEPTQTASLVAGAAVVDIVPGVYLMTAEQWIPESQEYIYQVKSAILYVPFIYAAEVKLKVEQTEQTGEIYIKKELKSYNKSLGGATFIFEVIATKNGVTVYEDMLTLSFTGPGKKTLRVANIPVGATVTATEVYSGACYKLEAGCAATQSTILVKPGTGDTLKFINVYNGGYRGGTSIVNNYTYQGADDSHASNFFAQQLVDNEYKTN